jgi:DNA polymerase I-like protein with 3'-5' exonuclease and polymerase domains
LERTLEEPLARGNQHYLAHDELVVECPEEQAEEVARFLEEVMVAGMDEDLNLDLDADHPDWVPVEVDVEVVDSWGKG